MIKIAIFTLLLFLLPGCGLLKRSRFNKQQSETNQSLMVSEKRRAQVEQSELFTVTDTNNKYFDLQIKPIGTFHFSADSGFRGAASYIRFTRKETTIHKASVAKKIKEELSVQTEVKLKHKSKQIAVKKTVETARINGTWILVLVIVAALCWWSVRKYLPFSSK